MASSSAPALPRLSRVYGRERSPVFPGQWEFRWRILEKPPARPVDITAAVESCQWGDDQGPLTGTLGVRRPRADIAGSLPVGIGDVIECSVRWRGGWTIIWAMRVRPPDTLDWQLSDGTAQLDLTDDLALLDQGERDWSYRATKTRPHGWTADEIARDVAQRLGVRVGSIARGKKQIKRLIRKNATGLDVLKAAYSEERDHSGTKFVIRLRQGRLEIIPLRRNPILYVFREQVEEAVASQRRHARPVTVIEGRARIGKGAHAKKIKHTASHDAVVRRLGRTVRKKDYGRVESAAELRRKCERDLASAIRVRRTATLTVPGVPFIQRGDAARWRTREYGWQGSSQEVRDRSYVYARTVAHSVDSSGYTTTIEFVQDDPYYSDQKRRDREARARARARRKGKAKGK